MYLVYGEEAYWHDRIIHLLSEHFGDGAENLAADEVTWSQIRELLSQPSFFGPRLWVVRSAKDLFNQPDDGWVHAIAPGNCLLLSSVTKENPAPKGFNKLLKDVGGKVIQASQPTFREASSWVQNKLKEDGYTITKEGLESLILIVGRSIERLEKEVEKLELYVSQPSDSERESLEKKMTPPKRITASHVLECVSPDPEMDTFGLVDAVAMRNTKKVFSELEELLGRGVSPIFIIAVLGSHFGLMWRTKEAGLRGVPKDSLGKELGVHPYAAKKASTQSANWTFPQMERAICALCDVDEAIKSGKIDPISAMDYVLMEILEG